MKGNEVCLTLIAMKYSMASNFVIRINQPCIVTVELCMDIFHGVGIWTM